MDLLEGFKIPKFDTFGEVGNPMAPLRAYCDQLVGVGRDEAYGCGSLADACVEKLLNVSPRMKPGNGSAGLHWPKILSINSFTT